jgi:hypothetical protein
MHPAAAYGRVVDLSLVLDVLARQHTVEVRFERCEGLRADHLPDRLADELLWRAPEPLPKSGVGPDVAQLARAARQRCHRPSQMSVMPTMAAKRVPGRLA